MIFLIASCYAVLLLASTFAAIVVLANQPWLRFMSALVAVGALVGLIFGLFYQQIGGFGIGGLVIAAGVVPLMVALVKREFATMMKQR